MQSAEAYPIGDLEAGHLMGVARLMADDEARRVSARVLTDDGEIEADVVVIAIPLALLVALPIDPNLPADLRAALEKIPTSTAAKLAAPLATPTPVNAIMSVLRRYWAYTTPCDGLGGATAGSSARGAGRIVLAGEHSAADGWSATIEGALRSGLRAAGTALGFV